MYACKYIHMCVCMYVGMSACVCVCVSHASICMHAYPSHTHTLIPQRWSQANPIALPPPLRRLILINDMNLSMQLTKLRTSNSAVPSPDAALSPTPLTGSPSHNLFFSVFLSLPIPLVNLRSHDYPSHGRFGSMKSQVDQKN